MSKFLKKRGRRFHFQKRVPRIYQHLFPKKLVQVSLSTDSEPVALQRAHNLNLILEEFWNTLADAEGEQITEQFQNIVFKAKISGFRYKIGHNIANESALPDFVNRINSADAVTNKDTQSLLLGKINPSQMSLSQALSDYFSHEEGNLRGHSEKQIRKWKNPRKKAIANFVRAIGDKPIEHMDRQDILDFRAWWIMRLRDENLTANSANKDFGFIKKILSVAVDNNLELNLPIEDMFKKIHLKEAEKTKRYPFETAFIQDTLFSPALNGLNEEARMLIYAMVNTGARVSELTGLAEQDIFLGADIPHIKICLLYTSPSPRDLSTSRMPSSA